MDGATYRNPDVDNGICSDYSILGVMISGMRGFSQIQSPLDQKWLRKVEASANEAGKNASEELEAEMNDTSPQKCVRLGLICWKA